MFVSGEYIYFLYENAIPPNIGKYKASDLSNKVWLYSAPSDKSYTSGIVIGSGGATYPTEMVVSGDYIYFLYGRSSIPQIGKCTTSNLSRVWINNAPSVSNQGAGYPTRMFVSGEYIYFLYENVSPPSIGKCNASNLSPVWLYDAPSDKSYTSAYTSGIVIGSGGATYPTEMVVSGDYIYFLYGRSSIPQIGKCTTSNLSRVWINNAPSVQNQGAGYPTRMFVSGDYIYFLYENASPPNIGKYKASGLSGNWLQDLPSFVFSQGQRIYPTATIFISEY